MSNNGGWAGWKEDADFAAFDMLPAEIRRAFAEAPYDLAFGDVAEQLAQFQHRQVRPMNANEVAFAVAAIREEVGFELEATAFALYGAAHPQARTVSVDCLADLKLLSVAAEMRRWRAGEWRRPDERVETRQAPAPPVADDFVPLHAEHRRPRRKRAKYVPSPKAFADPTSGARGRKEFAAKATYDPLRDGRPTHMDAASALMGDPPVGRRAIDKIGGAHG
jgi:hypothetical protein